VRVVLDTNILFSALISPHASPHRIFLAWREGRFELVSCRTQLDEIRRASRYPKLARILQPHRVGMLINALERGMRVDTWRAASIFSRTRPPIWWAMRR
jgi:putative PIN family toxin of toxin-antitoxin system